MSGDRADVSRSRLISMISNIINTEQRAINRLGQQAYCWVEIHCANHIEITTYAAFLKNIGCIANVAIKAGLYIW